MSFYSNYSWRDLPSVLAMLAVLATVVTGGIWRNQYDVEQALSHGYEATATVTGGNLHHGKWTKLTWDGWIPRVIDEEASLDLEWTAPDGSERARQKVPVTHDYFAKTVFGDRILVDTVAIKAVNAENAVPAILPDATARLAFLADAVFYLGAAAAALWFLTAIGYLWRYLRREKPIDDLGELSAHMREALVDTPKLTIPYRIYWATLVFLIVGGVITFQGWTSRQAFQTMMQQGGETVAQLENPDATLGRRNSVTYTLGLRWKDKSGAVRTAESVVVSKDYWSQITSHEVPDAPDTLTVTTTKIRYLESDAAALPVIIADTAIRESEDTKNLIIGGVMSVLGLAFGVWAARRTRRE